MPPHALGVSDEGGSTNTYLDTPHLYSVVIYNNYISIAA